MFWLSGENTKLAVAEIKAVSRIKKFNIYDKLLIAETNADKDSLESLAYTHCIYKYLFECKTNELENKIKNFAWEKVYNKDFCVKVNNFFGKGLEFSEKQLGSLVWQRLQKKGKKPNVNLTNTKTLIELFFTKKTVIFGLFILETDKKYLQRRPHEKPEFVPTSIIPKLARACVNLAGVKRCDIRSILRNGRVAC